MMRRIGAFLQTPIGVVLCTNAAWFIVVFLAGINYSYPYHYLVNIFLLGADLFIASYLLDRLVYFFSQFVLPIQNPKHRQEIYSRVKNFETGSRGPALFIKNGRVIMHEGEVEKRGPKVIVLDTASAAVLRTDTEIRDTIGPGVVFTKSQKKIMSISPAALTFGHSASLLVRLQPTSLSKNHADLTEQRHR